MLSSESESGQTLIVSIDSDGGKHPKALEFICEWLRYEAQEKRGAVTIGVPVCQSESVGSFIHSVLRRS
ncbi:hypothetical protein P691DRAFT_90396 [Macrolepiota fuliginosa MF-IS2]|uniref:Uncharacterized protein n=1 Tax=Macrolepiota fuliginosa MF-IS2 TaxID=1400762 RepID=A0A9P5X0D1_9AGAR|nr:hypothetical protein P691DRAFT_90396 [Macrolepiota fuliginosa MF-IS2]